MGRPSRIVEISSEQDVLLRDLELGAAVHPKVRLRASLLRLHRTGWNVPRLAQHFNRNEQSVHHDLSRFEQHGMLGIADAQRPGRPVKMTAEHEAVVKLKITEDRLWTAGQLAEVVLTECHVKVSDETVRAHLHALGYSWKRARYSPGKDLDPEVVQEHTASIETLKRGRWRAS